MERVTLERRVNSPSQWMLMEGGFRYQTPRKGSTVPRVHPEYRTIEFDGITDQEITNTSHTKILIDIFQSFLNNVD